MIVDPAALGHRETYRFLVDVVVPRPIAFVSTVGTAGFNLAPFSFFNAITSRPPLLAFSTTLRKGAPKDTLRNVRETGDFVVNVVSEELFDRMVQTSGDWPGDVSEFELAGLTAVASDLVKSPRVAESPVAMECRLYRELELGDAHLIVGEVLRAHVSDAIVVDGRVDPLRLKPVARMGGDLYTIVREVERRVRPKVEGAGSGGGGR
jgi:flavin reductase (DIM6/NTAB) family NADH-FMN oxidoreductase RutF